MSPQVATPRTARAERAKHRGERFGAAMATIVRWLPFGLSRVIAPTLVGFLIVNGSTFGVDMGLLIGLHGGLHWPLPVSITLSYGTAFALSFILNRALNFRSHSPVGPQLLGYTIIVAINYFAWILGVGAGLVLLGVDYHLSRLLAAVCEAGYMYAAMRWVVFRQPKPAVATTAVVNAAVVKPAVD
ncbi:MAG TPA: GtrA family protein [Pseudonocardiaceae bacterium]